MPASRRLRSPYLVLRYRVGKHEPAVVGKIAPAWDGAFDWGGALTHREREAESVIVERGDDPISAVLFDRDDTLVVDVPYNGDPARVEAVPGAAAALQRLRAAGIPTAVISNQSGIGRGLLTSAEVAAVNARLPELLGPVGPVLVCPHAPGAGCGCRKPAPGLVLRAAQALGVPARRCAVIGDIGADVEAAKAAGALGILVPTARTLPEEVAAAPVVAADLGEAVDVVLQRAAAPDGAPGGPAGGAGSPSGHRRGAA